MTAATPEANDVMVVILGAGASFDVIPGLGSRRNFEVSAPGLPSEQFAYVRPPLTKDLAQQNPFYNDILIRRPEARQVIDYLRREMTVAEPEETTRSLEAALSVYQAGADSVPPRVRHMLALRWYLRDILWAASDYVQARELRGVSNHDTLIRWLLDWAYESEDRLVVVISFNYDVIFEQALEAAVGMTFTNPGKYLSVDRIKVLKPHGSVSWAWEISGGNVPSSNWEEYEAASMNQAVEHGVIDDRVVQATPPVHRWITQGQNRIGQVPALALPIAGKADQVWPREQAEFFDSLLDRISRVLTIGWSALDPHFLVHLAEAIGNREVRTLITAGTEQDAQYVQARMQEKIARSTYERFGDGFSQFSTRRDIFDWLTL